MGLGLEDSPWADPMGEHPDGRLSVVISGIASGSVGLWNLPGTASKVLILTMGDP